MSDLAGESANSIVETSLTELAFIFFFILLIFSSWKINDVLDDLEQESTSNEQLQNDLSELRENLDSYVKYGEIIHQMEPEELFDELIAGRDAINSLPILERQIAEMESRLLEAEEAMESLVQSSNSESKEQVIEKLNQLESLNDLINTKDGNTEDLVKNTETMINDLKNLKGQNKNLRNKIIKIGNGLDHPPCWANEATGAIEYVFDIVIFEGSIEVHPGWPQSRMSEAKGNENIYGATGKYSNNSELWEATKGLYLESVAAECRYFVRVYDHAVSKSAFKNYLLGIENHFYKFLSKESYGY